MNMKNIILFLLINILFLITTVFGQNIDLEKMVTDANTIIYEPKIELQGDQVKLHINIKFPPKFFHKNASIIIIPVLKSNGKEYAFRELFCVGEKTHLGGTIISYDDGSEYNSTQSVPYKEEINNWELFVKQKITIKKETKEVSAVKIGEGNFEKKSNTPIITENNKTQNIEGSILYGNTVLKPLSNKKIIIKDENKTLVQFAITNEFGSFAFKNLPPDKYFLIELSPENAAIEPNTRVVLTNKNGEKITTTVTNASGQFSFELLPPQISSLTPLPEEDVKLVNMKGKLFMDKDGKNPLSNSKIVLRNALGEAVQTTITNKLGAFTFTKLNATEKYLFVAEKTKENTSLKELFLADEKGNIITKLKYDKDGFKWNFIPHEHTTLTEIYTEDTWLKIKEFSNQKSDSITVVENIYYDFGKWDILSEAAIILDKAVEVIKNNSQLKIEIISHTDSRGDAKTNLELSEKRAKAADEYLINKRISANRVSGKGMGETQLLNYCNDEVECTEEQHKINRRTEFKFLKTQ